MTGPVLGQLTRIDAREIWKHEAIDFTPWLASNIALLGEALGLELVVEATEVHVGDFSVDIVATDSSTGHRVIIENQLSSTDHSHLGQLLTYAAGQKASAMVWIAPRFRAEHREAMDWLNSNTVEDVGFFGVEMELLRIGDSPPAPHFKLVAQPNEWAKATKVGPPGTSEKGLVYQRFFSAVLEQFLELRPHVTSARRVGTGNWFGFAAGRSGFSFNWSLPMGGDQVRVELYIDTEDRDANKAHLDQFEGRQEELTTVLGLPVVWERLEQRRASRIASYHPVDRLHPDTDATAIRWAAEAMVRYVDVFRPLVKAL